MPKVALVTGSTGLLGRQVLVAFRRASWDAVGTGFSRAKPPAVHKLDLADSAAISSLLDEIKPQVVVHCAANRFPDKCNIDPDGARALNVDATRRLAIVTASRNILLIYISTDYVFPGIEGQAPYEADAPTHPPNIYGQTKLDGERVTLEQTANQSLGVILRVPVLYGKAEESSESAVNCLVDSVWRAQEKEAAIAMDDWAQRYPTNTEDVGRVCQDVATKFLRADDRQRAQLPKILQFSSEDRFTKFEICKLMAEILGLSLDGMVANKQPGDPSASVQRPYDTHLSTKDLEELGVAIWTQDFKAWWRRELHAVRH